jgi:hypothetical protein
MTLNKKIKKHFNEYQPLYVGLSALIIIAIVPLVLKLLAVSVITLIG